MLKKILFVIVSLGVGMILFLMITNALYSSVLGDIMETVTETKEYNIVERMYCYYTSTEEDVLYQVDEDKTHTEVFSALRVAPVCVYNEESAGIEQKTTVLYESFELVIFDITSNSDFVLEDQEGKKGHVDFYLDNSSVVTVNLDNLDKDSSTNMHYGNNYYALATNYHFLSVSLFYDEVTEGATKVTRISVYDGSETLRYDYEFASGLLLNNNFDKKLDSIKVNDEMTLREAVVAFNKARIDENEDEQKKLLDLINGIETTEINAQVDRSIVTKRPKFVIWCIVLIVLYIGIDAFVGFMIFRKKPNRNIPKNANIPPRDHMKQKNNVIDVKDNN